MINTVKRIIRTRRFVDPMDIYFNNVHRRGSLGGPTFQEAQKDFQDANRRYTTYQA